MNDISIDYIQKIEYPVINSPVRENLNIVEINYIDECNPDEPTPPPEYLGENSLDFSNINIDNTMYIPVVF